VPTSSANSEDFDLEPSDDKARRALVAMSVLRVISNRIL
jgi:hypothetical protein